MLEVTVLNVGMEFVQSSAAEFVALNDVDASVMERLKMGEVADMVRANGEQDEMRKNMTLHLGHSGQHNKHRTKESWGVARPNALKGTDSSKSQHKFIACTALVEEWLPCICGQFGKQLNLHSDSARIEELASRLVEPGQRNVIENLTAAHLCEQDSIPAGMNSPWAEVIWKALQKGSAIPSMEFPPPDKTLLEPHSDDKNDKKDDRHKGVVTFTQFEAVGSRIIRTGITLCGKEACRVCVKEIRLFGPIVEKALRLHNNASQELKSMPALVPPGGRPRPLTAPHFSKVGIHYAHFACRITELVRQCQGQHEDELRFAFGLVLSTLPALHRPALFEETARHFLEEGSLKGKTGDEASWNFHQHLCDMDSVPFNPGHPAPLRTPPFYNGSTVCRQRWTEDIDTLVKLHFELRGLPPSELMEGLEQCYHNVTTMLCMPGESSVEPAKTFRHLHGAAGVHKCGPLSVHTVVGVCSCLHLFPVAFLGHVEVPATTNFDKLHRDSPLWSECVDEDHCTLTQSLLNALAFCVTNGDRPKAEELVCQLKKFYQMDLCAVSVQRLKKLLLRAFCDVLYPNVPFMEFDSDRNLLVATNWQDVKTVVQPLFSRLLPCNLKPHLKTGPTFWNAKWPDKKRVALKSGRSGNYVHLSNLFPVDKKNSYSHVELKNVADPDPRDLICESPSVLNVPRDVRAMVANRSNASIEEVTARALFQYRSVSLRENKARLSFPPPTFERLPLDALPCRQEKGLSSSNQRQEKNLSSSSGRRRGTRKRKRKPRQKLQDGSPSQEKTTGPLLSASDGACICHTKQDASVLVPATSSHRRRIRKFKLASLVKDRHLRAMAVQASIQQQQAAKNMAKRVWAFNDRSSRNFDPAASKSSASEEVLWIASVVTSRNGQALVAGRENDEAMEYFASAEFPLHNMFGGSQKHQGLRWFPTKIEALEHVCFSYLMRHRNEWKACFSTATLFSFPSTLPGRERLDTDHLLSSKHSMHPWMPDGRRKPRTHGPSSQKKRSSPRLYRGKLKRTAEDDGHGPDSEVVSVKGICATALVENSALGKTPSYATLLMKKGGIAVCRLDPNDRLMRLSPMFLLRPLSWCKRRSELHPFISICGHDAGPPVKVFVRWTDDTVTVEHLQEVVRTAKTACYDYAASKDLLDTKGFQFLRGFKKRPDIDQASQGLFRHLESAPWGDRQNMCSVRCFSNHNSKSNTLLARLGDGTVAKVSLSEATRHAPQALQQCVVWKKLESNSMFAALAASWKTTSVHGSSLPATRTPSAKGVSPAKAETKPVTCPLGLLVEKDFGDALGGVFQGHIADFAAQVGLYKIAYEDGDSEEMTHEDVRKLLELAKIRKHQLDLPT